MRRTAARRLVMAMLVLCMATVSPLGDPAAHTQRAFAQADPTCTTDTPLPEAFTVAAAGDAPAGWAGAYEGIWDGNLPSRLIVERIDGPSAHVVYAWGDEPSGGFRRGFTRFAATLRQDGAIQWGPENDRFVFRMDGDVVRGELTRGSNVFRAAMSRCAVTAMAAPPDLAALPSAAPPIYDGPFTGPALAGVYRCPTGKVSAELVGEGYLHKVAGRCQDGVNAANAGSGPLAALQMADGELRFQYRAVSGRDRLQVQARIRLQDVPGNAVGYVVAVQPNRGILELRRQPAPNEAQTLDARLDLADRLATDDWVTIAVRAQGPNLFVLLNDEPMLAAYDSTFDRGTFQFATVRLGSPDDTAETAVAYRNLQVSPLIGGDPSRGPTVQPR